MKIKYQPACFLLNLFTVQMPQGTSYEVYVPNWATSIAIDKNGKIHAFESNGSNVWDVSSEWDSIGQWEEVADLEFEVDDWREMYFDLVEFDSETRCGGVFEIRKGV